MNPISTFWASTMDKALPCEPSYWLKIATHLPIWLVYATVALFPQPANWIHGIPQPSPQLSKAGQPEPLIPWLSQQQISEGWISLFDGKSLYGWQSAADINWQVVDGEIRASDGEVGLLRTTAQFDEYELRLEFRATERTNSGVFLRTNPRPRNPASECYEVNIAMPDVSPFPTGTLVARQKGIGKRQRANEIKLRDQHWHQLRIVANGNRIQVWVNGQPTADFQDPKPLGRGYIGLQKNDGPIAFKNIVLLPLNQVSLFNGKNLDGWTTKANTKSKLTVTDKGALRIQDGKGQIETTARFGDFVFSTHCRTAAVGLNSGVFFRCIPGEEMNGYESQIQNGVKDGDPTRPLDCGTGGIFRRKNARRVTANDQQWFSKTIVATGPHFSIWVNGYQVSDWTDQRARNKNPRRGKRLEPGTIIFQGHDPTTDISFRNIKAKELLPRKNY